MRIAVIGGGLQGVEAVYLAHKAGWEVLLIDRKEDAPASRLCDTFIRLDVTQTEKLKTVLSGVDLVIPANENQEALDSLVRWSLTSTIPLAFDAEAYRISSSKLKSDRLFAEIGIPIPKPWPQCRFPIIAKPSSGSGSEGVQLFQTLEQLEKRFGKVLPPKEWVLQEYLEGPSYSVEVVGTPGNYAAVQVTDLDMDAVYDCKRVSAPTELSSEQVDPFEKISIRLAEAVQLKGLMDVEVILHNGELNVLEIDARLPSQTPTAVYWSTGRNILEMLAGCFVKTGYNHEAKKMRRGAIYEHIKVTPETIDVRGEHIMSEVGPLHLETNFFGADEAITDYIPGRKNWVATLIVSGADRDETWKKRNRIIEEIKAKMKIREELES